MNFSIPTATDKLGSDRVKFLDAFTRSCRRSIVEMVRNSQSGHPGGSLSVLDMIATLYAMRVSKTDEKVVISNGHVSPAVYSVLAELGVIDRDEVVRSFRKVGSIFEGHVTRHVPGIWYGTGPLGVGISVATGLAKAEKMKKTNQRVFCFLGDGEMQEGQVHEAALFAAHEQLDNLTIFVDNNCVQISGTLEQTCALDTSSFFASKGWNVVQIDGHNFEEIWQVINETCKNRPTAVIGRTIMGHGVPGMEEAGQKLDSQWHGKAPKVDQANQMIEAIPLSEEEKSALKEFRAERNFKPKTPKFESPLSIVKGINPGEPKLYRADELTDCRSAYGTALADLAQKNPQVLAMSADLSDSVKTSTAQKAKPEQYVEFGICEQNMVSAAGGFSLAGFVPFCSTFGAFMTSRAKDQARVNDINQCNVKMVATHCGLSVGEDGPTHQAIDDSGSMLGLFNTCQMEPADPNHCDRLIRYAATRFGNFYIRMGRSKLMVLTKEDGTPFFDEGYQYEYGKTDVFRSGEKVTIVASGPMALIALHAREIAQVDAEIVIASSIKKFDGTLAASLVKTGKVITIEDHNPFGGLASSVAHFVMERGISLSKFESLGVRSYQLSGTAEDLYREAGIDAEALAKVLKTM